MRERDERVRTASAEAAEDDAYLAADAVERDAARLFRDAQEAWDARDRERLATLVGEDLMVEWSRRLDDFDRKGWHNRVEVLKDPKIQYVGLVNREEDAEDRVVVRLEAELNSYVLDRNGTKLMRTGAKTEHMQLWEYWTLARRDGRWTVASIEQQAEGAITSMPRSWPRPGRTAAWPTRRSPSSHARTRCPRGSPPPTWPSSTSNPMPAAGRWTCRWPTPVSRPTCSRSPPGAL